MAILNIIDFGANETEKATKAIQSAIYLCGLPEMPLGRIHLENIKAKGKKGMFTANTTKVVMKNVEVETFLNNGRSNSVRYFLQKIRIYHKKTVIFISFN